MEKTNPRAAIVDEIKTMVDGAGSVVTVSFLGINVEQDTRLRRELRENKVSYKVFKNTLIKRALEGTDLEQLSADLAGSTALAVSKDDVTAPARIIAKYAKEVESLKLKGGVVEGVYCDALRMSEIAAIPGREVLLSRLLGSLNSPLSKLARVLNQLSEQGLMPAGGPAESKEPADCVPVSAEAAKPAES